MLTTIIDALCGTGLVALAGTGLVFFGAFAWYSLNDVLHHGHMN